MYRIRVRTKLADLGDPDFGDSHTSENRQYM